MRLKQPIVRTPRRRGSGRSQGPTSSTWSASDDSTVMRALTSVPKGGPLGGVAGGWSRCDTRRRARSAPDLRPVPTREAACAEHRLCWFRPSVALRAHVHGIAEVTWTAWHSRSPWPESRQPDPCLRPPLLASNQGRDEPHIWNTTGTPLVRVTLVESHQIDQERPNRPYLLGPWSQHA